MTRQILLKSQLLNKLQDFMTYLWGKLSAKQLSFFKARL